MHQNRYLNYIKKHSLLKKKLNFKPLKEHKKKKFLKLLLNAKSLC